MNKKLIIALLTDGIYPLQLGGMQKHSYFLSKYLSQNNAIIHLYIPQVTTIQEVANTSNLNLENDCIKINLVPLPSVRKFPGHYLFESYLYSKNVYNILNNNTQPDLIYIQGFSGWHLLNRGTEPNWKSIPTIINFHGYNMFQLAPNIKSHFSYYFFRQAVLQNIKKSEYVISLGGKITSILQAIGVSKKIREIPIGIEKIWLKDSALLQPNLSILNFVFIGRYERLKGVEELNQVVCNIKEDFQLHFIGPIPENKQIKGLPKVKYYGAINDENRIKEILRGCDVLICPSWSEGMPTVILEAMASGCAIIATDVGAVSEQVDASNGILIQPGNKPELKAAIERMIALPAEQLLEMKKASIKRVEEKFLWDKVAELTISEIKKIIENRS
ncbi:glycosyltransferase family 4 protein [Geofilum rubicundum]|uniref:Glycosyltransferase n=1 Tax=Geofilum rubicundum JCM 15548 TaxID=1236989 RepID=A0A0E9LZZ0_9BACT|nr:glycosyltransferase family 4 protein [Geofilum rubicundum]GAO30420.1 glycosyltransferase [Geofilum rubicundum JCM 15548]